MFLFFKKYYFIVALLLFCFGLLFFSQNVFAAEPVTIQVKDMNGNPVSGVKVWIKKCEEKGSTETCIIDTGSGDKITDSKGETKFTPTLGDGKYTVHADSTRVKINFPTFKWPEDAGKGVTATPPATNPDCVDTIFTPFTGKQICKDTALKDYIGQLFNWATAIIGVAAALMLIYAGFIYMTSGGNEEKIDHAKQIIFSALAGLALIILAQIIFRTLGVNWL